MAYQNDNIFAKIIKGEAPSYKVYENDDTYVMMDIMPEAEGLGIGTMLVAAIKNEILDKNRLPFYGTAMSHIASQRVALGAGFVPAWSELYCEAIER